MATKFHAWLIGWTTVLVACVATVFFLPSSTWVYLFPSALVGYGVAVAVTWLALHERGSRYDVRMPTRPQVSSQGIEAMVRTYEPRVAVPRPQREVLDAPPLPELEETEHVAPAALAVEAELVPPAPEEETPTEAPAGFGFRGFTLYERKGPKGPVRVFSRGRPVGGGVPIPLPGGATARWDGKRRRPFLEWAKPAVLEEPAPAPRAPVPTAPAGPTLAAKPRPCSAIVGLGEFCENEAIAGGVHCRKHAATKGKPAAAFEVVLDRAEGPRRAVKFGRPELEVVQDRGEGAPRKPLRIREPRLRVEQDRRQAERAKPLKRREIQLVVERDRPEGRTSKVLRPRATELVVRTPRAPPPTLRGPKRRAPDPFAEQEEADARTRKAFAVASPTANLRIAQPNLVVARDARAAKPARPLRVPEPSQIVLDVRDTKGPGTLRVAAPDLEVRRDAPRGSTQRPLKVVEARIVAPKAKPILGFKLKGQDDFDVVSPRGDLVAVQRRGKPGRCVATLGNGKRCASTARQGLGTCANHAAWRPKTELVVQKDTKARTPLGTPTAKGRAAKR